MDAPLSLPFTLTPIKQVRLVVVVLLFGTFNTSVLADSFEPLRQNATANRSVFSNNLQLGELAGFSHPCVRYAPLSTSSARIPVGTITTGQESGKQLNLTSVFAEIQLKQKEIAGRPIDLNSVAELPLPESENPVPPGEPERWDCVPPQK